VSKKIKYTEIFYSFQGEGRYVGVPSVFLRTFGCNFECRNFGQPKDNILPKDKMPHNTFPIDKITNIKDLPIFDVGCDSSAAWSNRYKHLAPVETVEVIAKRIVDTLPQRVRDGKGERPHLVITGGEPLLGWQRSYPDLFEQDRIINFFSHITFETNGTQILSNDFINYLNTDDSIAQISEVLWSVSPKLSISGEKIENALNVESIKSMNEVYNSKVFLKFVVRNRDCLKEVKYFISKYLQAGVVIDGVYLMPEGATTSGLSITEREVAELSLENGYMYSPRLHVNVFGNKWGT